MVRFRTRMSNINDLQTRFTCVLTVFHETLCDVVKILSLGHPKSSGTDHHIALALILSDTPNLYKAVPSLSYRESFEKIYISRNKIKSSIDINHLDIPILADISLRVQGFLTNRITKTLKKKVPCTSSSHGKNRCCSGCNHECNICYKVICLNKCCIPPNNNCNHDCRQCNEKDNDCQDKLITCCKLCKICIFCAQALPTGEWCDILRLRNGIIAFKVFRHTYAHTTPEQYVDFELNTYVFDKYPLCTKWLEIFDILRESLSNVLYFLSNGNYITCDTERD